MWTRGIVDGVAIRRSLKVRSWEKAEKLKRDLELGKSTEPVTVEFAIEAFLAEQTARAVSEATQRKIKPLMQGLREFCSTQGLTTLVQLDLSHVRLFRASWKDSPISALKKLERLRSFFKFSVASGWIQSNPASVLKNPIVTDPPTLPFSDAEVQLILKHVFGKWHTLTLVLVYSGLRISDAMKLTPSQIQDGRLFLYQQKTKVPVYVPLPPIVISALSKLSLTGGYYFWRKQGNSKLETATGNARRAFRKAFKAANLGGHAHPHRFRDTFAVRLLRAGVPLEDVSVLLGHSSLQITEKHYAPWVQERQTRLEELVHRTWNQMLVRVK
jgi:integrase/recombinase XerD